MGFNLSSISSLANVDPIDVARNTLVVVVLRTFTTAETMLNVRTLREWISSSLGSACPSLFLMIEHNNFNPDAVANIWNGSSQHKLYSMAISFVLLPLVD
ncbi:Phosphoglucose isomerase (PGI) [Prunus yedoensis var. nudiflora]|uniref:Phosphoglucose isomerase (PGI) n=1 Tax=Prunus yedoensis var. nudiflora TaxID=2094558 RepID=A0A314Z4L5_PRUYE|nr:Phosphoglucose isomerase (PGI) [Prunus yedoensis var. nudiflora]